MDKLHGFAGGNCIPLTKHKTPFNEIPRPALAVMASDRKEYAFRRMQSYKLFSKIKPVPDHRLVHLEVSEALTVHISRESGPEASFCIPGGLADGETEEHSSVCHMNRECALNYGTLFNMSVA